MNMKDAKRTLNALGWSTKTDDVGDKSGLCVLTDRSIRIIYGLDRIRDEQKFEATLSVTTDFFSKSCSQIMGERPRYYPLVRARNGLDIRAPEILEEHVHQATDQAIEWGKQQDLDKALLEHAALPTDAPGARPVWHLAALALLRDVETLKFYQASFAAGHRLGFVPYIMSDYIDRALALAQGSAA